MKEATEVITTVHVLGPGALGLLWAAKLSSRQTIRLLGRQEGISTLRFTLHDGDLSYRMALPYHPVRRLGSETEAINTVLVFTKSDDTLPALLSLQPYLTPSAMIVLFQNGIGSHLAVAEAFPDCVVFAAVTTEGANRRDPLSVVHAGRGITRVGALFPERVRAADLADCLALLKGSDLKIEPVVDIRKSLWTKLAINCAINPFTAILSCPNGEITESYLFRSLWPTLKAELVELLGLAGYPVPANELEASVMDVVQRTAHNRSSMLQDSLAGRRTEIDAINGFAWRTLAEKGRPHAANLQLWQMVKELNLDLV